MLENKRAETLRLLRESGENVSGLDLCEHFGISRTAVWKIMNQLKEEGYEIEAVQNKGYRLLNEPDLMTKDELESRTHTKYVGQTVYYSHEVDSTNTWAKRLAEEGAPNGTLTTAETQTAGKGRRGRVWKSPEGTSVSMSLLLYPDLEPAKAPMLTIVMGLAVVQGVQRALGVDTRIKWPNDAVLNGKKLYLLDKLAAFRGMGLWALRLSFTTENAGEVDKVLADWVRGGTFEPGSYTRGLYQRGVE